MEKGKLQKLHKEVFSMMELIRLKIPNFYYGLRVKKDKRLKDGFLFHGNENYISVPISLKGNSSSRTSAIWLCFEEDKNGVLMSSLKIYPAEMKSKQEHNVFLKLCKLFPNKQREQTKEERYSVVISRNSSNIITDTMAFLDKYMEAIYKALRSGGTSMVYSYEDFVASAKNHIRIGALKLTV